MRTFLLPPLIFITLMGYAQPKLVGTLGYLGQSQGGGIFRSDLPASTPGMIQVFDNLAPHSPVAGVCAGNADWLYGILTYNGTNNGGARNASTAPIPAKGLVPGSAKGPGPHGSKFSQAINKIG